jgi:DNA-binding transcriptional ArsR family regulator
MSHIIDPSLLHRETLVFKAMASEARLAIIHTLSSGEKSVNELVEMLEGLACACSVERTNISKHLSVLREAGIISCRDEGLKRIYRLDFPCIVNTFECVERVNGKRNSGSIPACEKCTEKCV